MYQRLVLNILPFWKQFCKTYPFTQQTGYSSRFRERVTVGPSMPDLCINNPKRGTRFHKQSMDNPSSPIVYRSRNLLEMPLWSSRIRQRSLNFWPSMPIFSQRSSIVTSPLIRLVSLQSSGYLRNLQYLFQNLVQRVIVQKTWSPVWPLRKTWPSVGKKFLLKQQL